MRNIKTIRRFFFVILFLGVGSILGDEIIGGDGYSLGGESKVETGLSIVTTVVGLFGTIITSILLWRNEKLKSKALELENKKMELEIEKIKRELKK